MNGQFMTKEEVRDLYETIAENKPKEALEIIYEACGDELGLLYPTTQMHIAEIRK